MRKEIALVDCNNFFVGCEMLLNPDLIGKPVCVLSNNDGCVISRSNEAKKLGVKMCSPYFMAKREFPEVIYLSSNMSFYLGISKRIMQMLYDYTPVIEIYSIDEAFLDLTGMAKIFKMSYEELILKIKTDIKDKIGIDVSVGLANSKILAKIATDKAKKANGVYRIKYENIENELINISVQDVWSVGRNTTSCLKRYGIFSALDVLSKSDDFYKKIMGKRGLELKYELSGENVLSVVCKVLPPKSLQKTSSFPEFSSDKIYIKSTLNYHLHNICSKLRRLGLKANVVCVMLRTKDFRVFVERIFLLKPLNSEYFLAKEVEKLFNKIYEKDIIYRSSGIFVEDLKAASPNQLDIFENKTEKKAQQISLVWDRIEKKYGKGLLSIGFPISQ